MIGKMLSMLGLGKPVPTLRESHNPAWHRGVNRSHGPSRRAHQLARVYRLRARLSARHAA